jgi:hypothetical protein
MVIKLNWIDSIEKKGYCVDPLKLSIRDSIYQLPDDGILIDKHFVIINEDNTVVINWLAEKKRDKVESPFDLAPHIGMDSCDFYDRFKSKSKLIDTFNAYWNNPIIASTKVNLVGKEDRIKYMLRIGGESLKSQYIGSMNNTYCLYCFQINFMAAYKKQLATKVLTME